MIKKGFIAALAAGAMMILGACSFEGSNHNLQGNIKFSPEELTPKSFKTIKISVLADVYYTQDDGDNHEVRVDFSAMKNPDDVKKLRENIKVVYRENGVEIGLKEAVRGLKNVNEGKRPKIYITSPDLVKIDMEGVGSFHAAKINTDKLDIDNEGVGSVMIQELLANRVSISNEGVGSVTIEKLTGDDLDIDNEGVGSVGIGFYKGGKLNIDNEGVGKVGATVDCHTVHASLDGVGNVSLSGTTQYYKKEKDGIGSFADRGLKVLK